MAKMLQGRIWHMERFRHFSTVQPHFDVFWQHNHVSMSLSDAATSWRLLAMQPRLDISWC
jgi:hypothetical protein